MGRIELAAELEAMMHEAGRRLQAVNKGHFQRFIDLAAADLARVRPRTRLGSITLTAGQPDYPAPADLVIVKTALWGLAERRARQPWQDHWPGKLPCPRVAELDGAPHLYLHPAPTAGQITALGSEYKFYYVARHTVAQEGADTTVREADRHLLLVRAMVFGLRELAVDQSAKPVQLGDGVGSGPRNNTPAALADAWEKEFERMAAV